mgnify:FL=1
MKKKFTLLLLLALGRTGMYASTKLITKLNNNSSFDENLSDIRKWTFTTNNEINFIGNNNSSIYTAAVTAIDIMYFEGVATNLQTTTSSELFFYPNPATDYIYLKNLGNEMASLAIYRIDGVKMMSQTQSINEAINISSFPSGFYLLKVNNKIFKFRKL